MIAPAFTRIERVGNRSGRRLLTSGAYSWKCMCRFRVSLGFSLLLALTLLLAAGGVSLSRASGSSPQAKSWRTALASAARSAPDGQPAQITPRLRKARITRLTATPAVLPASGGKVHLWAVVHSATKCLFSSTSEVNGLPSIRRCKTGKVSTNIELLENTRSSTETYALRLTVKSLNGARTTRRVKVSVDGQTAGAVAPVITTQPADQSIGANQDLLFHATASGNPTPSVQWQVSTDGASSWDDIVGATSVYYVLLASATDNHYEYRAVFMMKWLGDDQRRHADSSPRIIHSLLGILRFYPERRALYGCQRQLDSSNGDLLAGVLLLGRRVAWHRVRDQRSAGRYAGGLL